MKPFLVAWAVWCATLTPGIAGPQGFSLYSAPQDMPEVRFVTEDGTRKTLSDFRGKAILVNIWATWCPPCVTELPTLDALQVDLGDQGFEVVALSIDTGGAPIVRRFFDKVGIKQLIIDVDPTQLSFTNLRIAGLPTTLLISADGKEVGQLVGPAIWNEPEMEAFLKGFAQ
jgi:thiol-disulfide isomerase/thioredoxin